MFIVNGRMCSVTVRVTSLYVWCDIAVRVARHYMYVCRGITCTCGVALHVHEAWHYMFVWRGITCTCDVALHVRVAWHYMYVWSGIACTCGVALHVILALYVSECYLCVNLGDM